MTAPVDNRVLKMVVLSDIHASNRSDLRSTWAIESTEAQLNPLSALEQLVADEGLSADVVLCPGDLCDRADWDALPYAWSEIHRFADSLSAQHVIATIGNHDVDSHEKHAGKPIDAALRQLDPAFPCDPGAEHYWSSRVARVVGDDWQVVSLNSSLMRYLEDGEKDHGLVEDQTLGLIEEITKENDLAVNVLLCHHHPQPFTRLAPGDVSHMDAGDRLVSLLNQLPETWMIIHGHRHQPHLDYLEGSAASPARLVAGSAGVVLWPLLSSYVRNQIHLVEFPIDLSQSLDLSLAGLVRSWSWQPGGKWIPARAEGDGLPGIAGFGYRTDGPSLARSLVKTAEDEGVSVVERERLETWQPRLPFLLPEDLGAFRRHLEQVLHCHLHLDTLGDVEQVILPSG
jgi:predicted MPP superfamily phosphohydrolase